MPLRCLFHVHTRHSFDSLLTPSKILSRARDLNIDLLIVTDHNTLQGARAISALSVGQPPYVIQAAEYQSEKGDLIGLFLKEEIRSRNSAEILQQIHGQNGLVVLPHPFKGHKLDEPLLAGIDLVETWNGRCSPQDNQRAAELAASLHRPVLAGADAHCAPELSTVLMEFDAPPPQSESEARATILQAPRQFLVSETSPYYRHYSQLIKAVKLRDPRLFLYQAKRAALTFTRRKETGAV